MSGLYSWVGNIVFYMIFITVINGLLPAKKYERYLKLFAGMVLILLVLKPLTGSLRLEDKIAYYFKSITFQNESEDLKKEVMGMERQRLGQMIIQYEEAVEQDVEVMARDMDFYPVDTKATIEADQDNQQFGQVTHIRMTVSREEPEQEEETGTAVIEPVTGIEEVERVKIGEENMRPVPKPDETLNRLRRKVEEYYGLKTADVEIELAEGEG